MAKGHLRCTSVAVFVGDRFNPSGSGYCYIAVQEPDVKTYNWHRNCLTTRCWVVRKNRDAVKYWKRQRGVRRVPVNWQWSTLVALVPWNGGIAACGAPVELRESVQESSDRASTNSGSLRRRAVTRCKGDTSWSGSALQCIGYTSPPPVDLNNLHTKSKLFIRHFLFSAVPVRGRYSETSASSSSFVQQDSFDYHFTENYGTKFWAKKLRDSKRHQYRVDV